MEPPHNPLNDLGWRWTLLLMCVLGVLPLVVIVTAMNLPWQATFSISAQTEIVEFEIGQNNVPNWFVTIDRMRIDGVDAEPFTGQLEIGRDTHVRLVRLQVGALRLTLDNAGQGPAATLYDNAENRVATAQQQLQALIEVQPGQAITLPIAGRAVIGDTIFSQSVETSPVLIDGHVQVFGRYVIGRNRFAAQQAPLDAGDRLEIDYTRTAPGGHGLLRIQADRPGVGVVFHTDAETVRVIRFGTAGYELSPSWWARVSSDPLYQSLLAIYAVLLPAIGLALASLFNQWRLRQMARRKCQTNEKTPAGPRERPANDHENHRPDDLQSGLAAESGTDRAQPNAPDNDNANI